MTRLSARGLPSLFPPSILLCLSYAPPSILEHLRCHVSRGLINQSITLKSLYFSLSLSSSYRFQQQSSEEQNTTLFSFHLPSNFSFSSPPHYSFSFHDRRHRQQDKKRRITGSLRQDITLTYYCMLFCCDSCSVSCHFLFL